MILFWIKTTYRTARSIGSVHLRQNLNIPTLGLGLSLHRTPHTLFAEKGCIYQYRHVDGLRGGGRADWSTGLISASFLKYFKTKIAPRAWGGGCGGRCTSRPPPPHIYVPAKQTCLWRSIKPHYQLYTSEAFYLCIIIIYVIFALLHM